MISDILLLDIKSTTPKKKEYTTKKGKGKPNKKDKTSKSMDTVVYRSMSH